MSRAAAMLVLAPCLLWACGRHTEDRKVDGGDAAAVEGEARAAEPHAAAKPPTALPATRPVPFQAEYRVGTPDSGDLVSTTIGDEGARVSLGDREHRVVISFDVTAAELDRAYAALRAAAFDRIETSPSRQVRSDGTSLRLLAGKLKKSVSDFGHVDPDDAWAGEYDAAAKALEPHLPTSPGDDATTIEVRWDASMKGHRATVALALGGAFAGATKISPEGGDVRVGLRPPPATPAQLTATLRAGPPATSSEIEIDPDVHEAIEVVFDPETSMPVARPIARAPGSR
jgi:hypothetical protein